VPQGNRGGASRNVPCHRKGTCRSTRPALTRFRMRSFGNGCSATHAPTAPRSIHAKTEAAAAKTKRPIVVKRIPAKTNEPAVKKPATKKKREVACCATGGHRPRAMLQKNAPAIATARAFPRHPPNPRAYPSENSSLKDQT